MTDFHLFNRLPAELRHRIWQLSPQSRDVVLVLRNGAWRSLTKSPAVLHACHEARRTLALSYNKAFHEPIRDGRSYIWVDFNIDSICIGQDLLKLLAETAHGRTIRHLTVECSYMDQFWVAGPRRADVDSTHLFDFDRLKTLTIVYMEDKHYSKPDRCWRDDLTDMFAEYYYTCKPVLFEMRAMHPRLPETGEVNRTNFVKISHDNRKSLWQSISPGTNGVSDSEDEDIEGRHRWFRWKHDGCNCVKR